MTRSAIRAGLDVHEDSIVAAILEGDELRAEIVKLSSDLQKVRRLFGRLSPALPDPVVLRGLGPRASCSSGR